MVRSCAAINCSQRNAPNISFFKFPIEDPTLCKKWLVAMRRSAWKPSEHSLLCMDHFSLTDFTGVKRKKLKPGTVPSKFSFPEHLQPKPSIVRSERANLQSQPIPKPLEHAKNKTSEENKPESTIQTDHSYCSSPRKTAEKCKAMLNTVRRTVKRKQQCIRRQLKKIKTYEEVIKDLKSKLCSEGHEIVKNCFGDTLKQLLQNQSAGKKIGKFTDDIRKFALTLHFYSAKAYKYMRQMLPLPGPRTLRTWAMAVDGEPGFTEASFRKLEEEVKKNGGPIHACLMFDEIAIKKDLVWDGKKTVGYVDLGQGDMDNDDARVAREALVFMITAVDKKWKLPVGYCLIDGLSSELKENLILQYLRKLHESNIKIIALTCDGTSSNRKTFEDLGVRIHANSKESLKSYFNHPSDPSQKVFCFLDAAHMIKLLRNLLGDKRVIIDGLDPNADSSHIRWSYFEDLVALQTEEGLQAANKLKQQHIQFKQQKMKVSLAASTLSRSVGKALLFCENLGYNEFAACAGTAKFCQIVDSSFDLLNSSNPKGAGSKAPINKNREQEVRQLVRDNIKYFQNLKFPDGQLVLQSARKTPVYGMILNLLSVEGIAENYIWNDSSLLKYLLTRRFSQDHLELFFATIRSKGGDSNNPNALSFRYIYRKSLVARVDDAIHECANAVAEEGSHMLSLSTESSKPKNIETETHKEDNITTETEQEIVININPELEKLIEDFENYELSKFSAAVIEYVSGYVVHTCLPKLQKKCEECSRILGEPGPTKSDLILFKDNKGGLRSPSEKITEILKAAEMIFRQFKSKDFKSDNLMETLIDETIGLCKTKKYLHEYSHFKTTSDQSHYLSFLNLILKQFFTTRIYHLLKVRSAEIRGEIVRQKLTKLIIFKGQ